MSLAKAKRKLGFTALNQNKFSSSLPRADHLRFQLRSHRGPEIPQPVLVNTVCLAYQTFRSVKLIHLYQVVSSSIEIQSHVALATLGFEETGGGLENLQYVRVQFLIITRLASDLAALSNVLTEFFALLTHDFRCYRGGSMQDSRSPMTALDRAVIAGRIHAMSGSRHWIFFIASMELALTDTAYEKTENAAALGFCCGE